MSTYCASSTSGFEKDCLQPSPLTTRIHFVVLGCCMIDFRIEVGVQCHQMELKSGLFDYVVAFYNGQNQYRHKKNQKTKQNIVESICDRNPCCVSRMSMSITFLYYDYNKSLFSNVKVRSDNAVQVENQHWRSTAKLLHENGSSTIARV